MEIRFGKAKNLLLTAEGKQFVLYEEKIARQGKEAGKIRPYLVGYYSHMKCLLKSIRDIEVKHKTNESLEQLADNYEKSNELILSVAEELRPYGIRDGIELLNEKDEEIERLRKRVAELEEAE